MLTNIERILFGFLVIVSITATVNTFGQMIAIINRGQGKLNYDNLPKRIRDGLIALFSQGRIIRHRRLTSLFHYGVAWGFIFYFLVNAIDVLEGMIPGFLFFASDNPVAMAYRFLADIFSISVLIGVLYFIIRRFGANDPVLKARENVKMHPDARSGVPKDSLIVAFFILLHVGFRFFSATMLVAQEGADAAQPFATLAANLFANWPEPALNFGWHFGWWMALGLILIFLPYFPYTKHAHLFMGPFNFMTAPNRTYKGQVFTLDFENESIEQFGANTLFDLHKTQIVDAFACIMCNRCQQACPAYNTGKELSPAAIEINKRYYLRENMAALANGEPADTPLLEFTLSESALWACTTCGACIDVCPVGNAPMLDIIDIRRDQVLMASEFPGELQGAFRGMERQGNPWQSTDSRMAWAEPLDFDVPTVAENPNYEYLLWVGCAGAFNPDSQEVVRATATILHEAGVSFAVLGEDETCTGDSARRAGNEYLYYEMAQGNIETLNAAGADKKKIVTSCPHCLTTIGKEYGELGGHYTVYHHTQLIANLIGQGKLRLNGDKLESVTFHDPCYLGRHNGIVNDPRDVLAKAGATLLEMDRHGTDSFCCGAGGAQYWKEEEHGDTAVNATRFQEARATGAKTLAVGCPFCATMMLDANREAGEPMQVKDVAALVVEAMQ
ncbi:MAG: (Fe-S)-binding protein [Candidatus Promineifilaceae bacterium]